MDFGANKIPVEIIKEHEFGDISETLILVLIVNGIENHGKNLMNFQFIRFFP